MITAYLRVMQRVLHYVVPIINGIRIQRRGKLIGINRKEKDLN